MGNKNLDSGPTLKVESVSAVFAHDISTPLTTAKMNADLLVEYRHALANILNAPEADKIPAHIKLALERAPELIQENLLKVQKSLTQYKNYLNCLRQTDKEEPTAGIKKVSAKRLNILMVDDEEIHHDIGDAVLGENHQLAHENSGVNAIKRCEQEPFDIVLMDMQMPNLTGPQTAERLRLIFKAPTLIIGLSNMPIQSKKQQLLDCGFNGFLDKPLKLNSFNQLIASLATISN